MAEAVVGVLIGKLGAALVKEAAAHGASLLCKEASAVKGLFGEIHKDEVELESMKAYLHESEKFKDTDEITSIFVNKIRELSFHIEDVIDEFMYKLEDDKHGGFAAKIKKWIKHVKVWHRVAHKLRNINAELEDAAKKEGPLCHPRSAGTS
jgi:disease resistance protein RPM1